MPTFRVHFFDQYVTVTGLEYVEAVIRAREDVEIDGVEEIKECDADNTVRCDDL
jgi:hypothetical protein